MGAATIVPPSDGRESDGEPKSDCRAGRDSVPHRIAGGGGWLPGTPRRDGEGQRGESGLVTQFDEDRAWCHARELREWPSTQG